MTVTTNSTRAIELTKEIDKGAILENIERNATKKSYKLVELVNSAKDKMDVAQGYVADSAADKGLAQGKEFIKALMEPAKALLSVLEAVQEIHPAIAVAVGVFKVVIQLALEKHENDKRIAVLYYTMTDSLFVLSYLDPVFNEKDKLKDMLKDNLEGFCRTMNEFGNFCDLYYKHGSTVRVLLSGRYKGKLTGLAAEFADHKTSLQELVMQRTAVTVSDMKNKLDTVSTNIDTIIKVLGIKTLKEAEAASYIEAKGGESVVLNNDALLNQVATRICGQELSLPNKYILRTDLTLLLDSNMALYNMKIDTAVIQIEESVQRSTGAILSYLQTGAHDGIEDLDIRFIWKDMGWKHTVKARHFVESVQYYFAGKFAEHQHTTGEPHEDVWTLKFLSNVIFYPNIWDAIDKDSSGYLTVWEINRFFQAKPSRLTSPQWLSYWAVGHYKNLIVYRNHCIELMDKIVENCHKSRGSNRKFLKVYAGTDALGDLRLFVESVYRDTLSYHGQLPEVGADPLDDIRRMQAVDEAANIRARLEKTKYRIDSASLVKAFTGTRQLETIILCTICLVLQRHSQIIELTRRTVVADEEIQAMTTTLFSINYALELRLNNLLESWRQQRMDSELQVQCFASGLFEDYWTTYYKDDDSSSESENGSDNDESPWGEDIVWAEEKKLSVFPDDTTATLASLLIFPELATALPEGASRAASPVSAWGDSEGSTSGWEDESDPKLTMDERMTALESKVDNLTTLMEQLVAATSKNTGAGAHPQHNPPRQGTKVNAKRIVKDAEESKEGREKGGPVPVPPVVKVEQW